MIADHRTKINLNKVEILDYKPRQRVNRCSFDIQYIYKQQIWHVQSNE